MTLQHSHKINRYRTINDFMNAVHADFIGSYEIYAPSPFQPDFRKSRFNVAKLVIIGHKFILFRTAYL